jgi:hypothetical protein
VKLKLPIWLSLGLNLTLAILLAWHWHRSIPAPLAEIRPASSLETGGSREISRPVVATALSAPARFSWRMIESDDYRRYLANLRKVECPEYLVRDILVADLDDLYATRKRSGNNPCIPPWQGADDRRATDRRRLGEQYALEAEKRALVMELLGYPWDNHADEMWHQEIKLALLLGFLPGDRASQTLALARQYHVAAENIRTAAHNILIEQDRTRLRELYEGLVADVSRILTPAEFEELQLRVQAVGYFPAQVHLEGVSLRGPELRELARLTRTVQDVVQTEFTSPRPLLDEEREARIAAFDARLKSLLGPERFADYQRAQDYNFRESFEFARRNQLPDTIAIAIYNARQTAETQATKLKADSSLTSSQQMIALETLKNAIAGRLSTALGERFDDYLAGPGNWLQSVASSTDPPRENPTP